MPTLHRTITVDRSLEDCFRYLQDFSTIEQWDPGVYRSEKVQDGPPRIGTTFDLTLDSFGGRKVPMTYEIVEMEPPHRLRIVGDGGHFSADDVITLEALPDGRTSIDYRADLQFEGPLATVFKIFGGALEKVGEKAVTGMKNALTIPTRPPRRTIKQRIADRAVLPSMINFTERGYLKMDRKAHSEFMDHKTVVITGFTAGLGLAAACEISRLGADLILVGRTPSKIAAAIDHITAFSGRDADHIRTVEADLAHLDQMHRAADEIAALTDDIDVLINNAGALFNERQETPDGHEKTLAINLLCPYVLTSRLIDHLDAADQGRVINVTSGGMYAKPLRLDDMQFRSRDYRGTAAYAHAKRALVDITDHFANAYRQTHITFNSMHPGWADTPGVEKSLPAFHQRLDERLRDARMGADTVVWMAAASALSTTTGELFLDRKPRPKALLPNTLSTDGQRRKLAQWLQANTARPDTSSSPRPSQ